jgi:hypothetical protein
MTLEQGLLVCIRAWSMVYGTHIAVEATLELRLGQRVFATG